MINRLIWKFDMAIYRLFYWRWNKRLMMRGDIRRLFMQGLTEYERMATETEEEQQIRNGLLELSKMNEDL